MARLSNPPLKCDKCGCEEYNYGNRSYICCFCGHERTIVPAEWQHKWSIARVREINELREAMSSIRRKLSGEAPDITGSLEIINKYLNKEV